MLEKPEAQASPGEGQVPSHSPPHLSLPSRLWSRPLTDQVRPPEPRAAPPPITARLRGLVNPKGPLVPSPTRRVFHESWRVSSWPRFPTLQVCKHAAPSAGPTSLIRSFFALCYTSGQFFFSTALSQSQATGPPPNLNPRPQALPSIHDASTPSITAKPAAKHWSRSVFDLDRGMSKSCLDHSTWQQGPIVLVLALGIALPEQCTTNPLLPLGTRRRADRGSC